MRQKEVIKIIAMDNKISYKSIAKKLDINTSAVDKHIKALKKKGVLKRIGGTKGHWEIINYEH